MAERMTPIDIKTKCGERILNLTINEWVVQGMNSMKKLRPCDPLGRAVKNCFEDITAQDWQTIRAIIKRNL